MASLASMEIDAHQSVDRFMPGQGMVFAHADQPVTIAIQDTVCIAHFSLRGDGSGFASWLLAINALIGEIGEIYCATMNRESATAILMHRGSGVEGRRSEVDSLPFPGAPHNDAPAGFRRSHLDPVDILPFKSNLLKPDSSGCDHVRCDR